MRRRYSDRQNRDPYWLDAKFASKCSKCDAPIKKGDKIFYYPSTKSAMGQACGHAEEASADFQATVFDEAVYNY